MFPSGDLFSFNQTALEEVRHEVEIDVRSALAVATIAVLGVMAPAVAQDPSSIAQAATVALIPGTLTGLGSMGPRGVRRFCDARAIGLSQWRTTALTRIIGLDKPQQSAALSELSAASAKALEMIASTSEQRSGKIPARHYGSSG